MRAKPSELAERLSLAVSVALGLKARTGRAILVTVGLKGAELQFIERTELKLLPDGAFAPYHAVEGLKPAGARQSLESSIAAERHLAEVAIRNAVERISPTWP